MRQVQAERFIKANPKLKISTNVVGTADPPMVKFEFVDGTQVSHCMIILLSNTVVRDKASNDPIRILLNVQRIYDSQQYVAKEMMEDILLAANALDIGYELEGKSIDDK